jgi:hypothetical protein
MAVKTLNDIYCFGKVRCYLLDVFFLCLVSRAGIGVQAVRRYDSGQIGYRAMYVRIGNPVVCSIDRT